MGAEMRQVRCEVDLCSGPQEAIRPARENECDSFVEQPLGSPVLQPSVSNQRCHQQVPVDANPNRKPEPFVLTYEEKVELQAKIDTFSEDQLMRALEFLRGDLSNVE